MEKRKVFALFVFLLFIFSIMSICAATSKVDKNVINGLNNQKIRVVIHLTEGNSFNSKRSLSASDSFISSEKINYRNNNNVFASLTKEEIEQLANSNSVESIGLEKRYEISLQDSVSTIRANDSWDLQIDSLNLTGSGQTVCIIDTGINYSHPDFGGCTTDGFSNGNCEKVIGGWNTYLNNNNILDDNGHGTHVAGIVAANGAIKGVSPNSKLVIIKADDGSGFWSEDIIEGINWCVNNASKFNISVISMSLGINCNEYPQYCYPGYCNDETEVDAINAAVAKNISIVISSGNNGNSTHLSSPACIENATAVTSSSSNDNGVSVFANTWNNSILKILAAPGENINSTYFNGRYSEMDGTSMSTPHVAGAILIINQFLSSRGKTMTSLQIENLLNSTGKQIINSANGKLFSRINVYSALLSIDDIAPSIELLSPADNLVSPNTNKTFICNASDWQLKNMTLNVWNSSGLYFNETKNISGKTNQSEFNLTEMPNGHYDWNCLAIDNVSNSAYSTNNFSTTIGGVNLELASPENNSNTNTAAVDFICNATSSNDRELKNMSFFIFENNTLLKNSSLNISGVVNGSVFSYTLVDEVNYTWGCETYSNESDYSAKNYTVSYEKITAPAQRTSSGGGGGGGGSAITTLSESQLSSGVSKKLNSGEKVNIIINNQNHSLQLNKILNNSVNLTIRSEPIVIIISLGEERKINLTSINYYDLYIKVENVTKNSAGITLKEINESIYPAGNNASRGKRYDISQNDTTPKESNNVLVYVGIALVAGILLFWFLMKNRMPPKKRTRVKK